jgi:hypothetical protein
MRRFRPDTHSASKVVTIRAGATVLSPAISNAKLRCPARSTNVWQTRGTRLAIMPRRPPIKTPPALAYLLCPSGPHPTEATISAVLECLIRNRPDKPAASHSEATTPPPHVALKDNMLSYRAVVFGAGQNLLPCSSDMRGHDENSSDSQYGDANSQCPAG